MFRAKDRNRMAARPADHPQRKAELGILVRVFLRTMVKPKNNLGVNVKRSKLYVRPCPHFSRQIR